ncbi:MAG: hypothetical protein ACAH22_02310 [Tardiphaga sp.]
MTGRPGQDGPPVRIALNDAEAALLKTIKLDAASLEGSEDAHRNGLASCKLMKSLLERNAIPAWRTRFFSDPSYSSGGCGKSTEQIFVGNGCDTLEKLFAHPHFLDVLRYFLEGPDLPQHVALDFHAAVADCGMVTSSDLTPPWASWRAASLVNRDSMAEMQPRSSTS